MADTASGTSELARLASRALEILVTHNEAVGFDDLACALGVSEARATDVATRLGSLGYATLDSAHETATAAPAATESEPAVVDSQLALLKDDPGPTARG